MKTSSGQPPASGTGPSHSGSSSTGTFTFTVTDLARFLGKSSATLRKWEQQGLVTFPRLGQERRASTDDLRQLSQRAFELGRITKGRLQIIEAAVTLLDLLEG